MAKANMRRYDEILSGTTMLAIGDEEGELNKEQIRANQLNKLAYNELVLSCNDKISFGIIKNAKTKTHPK